MIIMISDEVKKTQIPWYLIYMYSLLQSLVPARNCTVKMADPACPTRPVLLSAAVPPVLQGWNVRQVGCTANIIRN